MRAEPDVLAPLRHGAGGARGGRARGHGRGLRRRGARHRLQVPRLPPAGAAARACGARSTSFRDRARVARASWRAAWRRTSAGTASAAGYEALFERLLADAGPLRRAARRFPAARAGAPASRHATPRRSSTTSSRRARAHRAAARAARSGSSEDDEKLVPLANVGGAAPTPLGLDSGGDLPGPRATTSANLVRAGAAGGSPEVGRGPRARERGRGDRGAAGERSSRGARRGAAAATRGRAAARLEPASLVVALAVQVAELVQQRDPHLLARARAGRARSGARFFR